MADYSAERADAYLALAEAGTDITFTREVDGTYDPATHGMTGGTIETLSGVGILLSYKASEYDNETVLRTDKKLIYSGDEPAIGDYYGDYRVVDTNPLDPDEQGAIIYTCQLRK